MKKINRPLPPVDHLPTAKNVSPLTMARVGILSTDKASSFVNFPLEKPQNVIRVGCFGDSFTYGAEVDTVNDYPSLLQNIFTKNGYHNVEVINFGLPYLGFHQAFMVWKYVGQQYDLDYIILGPEGFWMDRDSTFNHDYASGYYLHARYILDNQSVKLIDVIGNTYTERTKHYNRFIPHFRYLRFDSRAPLFLQSLIFWSNDILKNPFYYTNNVAEEINKTYRILLTKIAQSEKQIILCHHRKDIIALAEKIHKQNIHSLLVPQRFDFPYRAPKWHNSPYANQLFAQYIFDCLTNKKKSTLSYLATQDINPDVVKGLHIDESRLLNYTHVAIEINNRPVGFFYDLESRLHRAKAQGLSRFKTKSLLAIKTPDTSILNAIFLPLDFDLADDMPVIIEIETRGGAIHHQLGNVKLLNNGFNLGTLNIPFVWYNELENKISLRLNRTLTKDIVQTKHKARILLNNKPIFHGTIMPQTKKSPSHDKLSFYPLTYELQFIRYGMPWRLLPIEEFDKEGIIYLACMYANGKKIKIPLAQWKKETHNFPLGKERDSYIKPVNYQHLIN